MTLLPDRPAVLDAVLDDAFDADVVRVPHTPHALRPARTIRGVRAVAARSSDLPAGASPRLHDLGRRAGPRCLRPVLRVRVHQADRIPVTGPVVLVANHSAMVDGPLLFGVLGRRAVFLVKREVFRGPLAWLLPLLGQLPVHRGTADATSLRSAARVLHGGGLLGVFPEGTRGVGDVAAAQHGAAWLARATGAVVLPVAVRGTRRTPGTRPRVRPAVDVLVGTPFAVAPGGGREGLVAATETVRATLAGLVATLDAALDERRKTP